RLALIDLVKHLTARGKRGRRPSRIFTRAWLVQQLTKQARGRHRQEQKAWQRDRQKNPRPSLKRCAAQAVNRWAVTAEFTRLSAEYEGQDLAAQIADLPKRTSGLVSSVLTELRGRGVAKQRRRRVVT